MYLGDFVAGATIYHKWATVLDGTGSITRATNGTVRVYKNGSDVQRSSSAGITDTEDFDSLTGFHHLAIDLADNTDAGFYAAGNDYQVMVQGMVIDGMTLNVPLCSFSIENRNDKADVREFGGSAGTFSGGRPEVNTTHAAGTAWGSGAITAASIAADAITAAKIATGAIDADAIADNAIDAGAIATGAITAAKFGAGAIDAAALAADAGTEIATAVWALGTRTLTSLGTGSGLTAIPWNAAWDAEVQSEVDDALVAQNLDHLVKIAVDTNFATTVHADSVIGQIADNGAGFDRTTDSLEAIRDRGDAAWTTASGFSTHSASDVWAVGTRVLTANTNLNDPSAATIASAVRTELGTELGRIDVAISTRLAAASYTAPDNASIAAILTDTGTTLDGKIDTIDGIVDAIKAKTDLIPGTMDGLTFTQMLTLIGAALLGKLSGAPTTTVTIRAADDSKDRITATVDADGNRTAVTLDGA